MITYLLTDGHGKYIKYDKFSGRYTLVGNQTLAERWEQRSKAANVLKNAISKNLRNRYKIIEIEEREIDVNKNKEENNKEFIVNKKKEDVVKEVVSENKLDTWNKGINSVVDFIQDARERKEELLSDLSNIDKEVTDIYHYIETGKFNAYQGWLIFDMLRQRLKKRRKIKNELEVVSQLGECKIDTETLKDIQKAIAEIENRTYKPRVLKELFE